MNHFICPVRRGAILSPKKIAIVDQEKKYTYEELDQLISSLSNGLLEKKIKKIASWRRSSLETILLLFASFRSSLSLFLPSDHLPHSTAEEYISSIDALSYSPCFSPSFASDGVVSSEESSLLLLTSGSQKQKLVQLSFSSLFHSATSVNQYLGLSEEDSWVLSLPLFHVSGIGIVFRIFLARGTLIIPQNKNQLLGNYLSLVPTQLRRIVEGKIVINRREIKGIIVGGAKLGKSLYMQAKKENLPIHITYGLTESSSQILSSSTPYWSDNIPFLGFPLEGSEMKLENNQIFIRGKTLFSKYLNHIAPWEDGWFPTADLGLYSPTYGFACAGRIDRMFISGGENIHPEAIERALLSMDGIFSALVVPETSEEFGAIPTAFIDYDKEKIELSECKKILEEMFPKFMIPKKIFPWEMAPKSELLKEENLSVSSL